MPAAVPAIITAVAGLGSSAIGAISASSSSRRTLAAQQAAIDKQLAYEREQEDIRRADQERYAAETKLQWEAEQKQQEADRLESKRRFDEELGLRRDDSAFAKQQYANRQAQMAPYRQAGAGALAQLAALAGVSSGNGAASPAPPLSGSVPVSGAPSTGVPAAAPSRPSFFDNPNIMPPSRPITMSQASPSASDVPQSLATLGTPVAISDGAYQSLAANRPAGLEALTPAQVAALKNQLAQRGALASLARGR